MKRVSQNEQLRYRLYFLLNKISQKPNIYIYMYVFSLHLLSKKYSLYLRCLFWLTRFILGLLFVIESNEYLVNIVTLNSVLFFFQKLTDVTKLSLV